jgi:predicted enzyme related to lactoylglutathione lyase
MPEPIMYPPGTFCWADLGTTDVESTKTFYAELFGWKINETHVGSWTYIKYTRDDKDVAALYQIIEGQLEKGYPVAWIAYMAVDNVDEYAEKIKALGGKILRGPFDVSDQGRTISLIDPTGATFYLWQAGKHKGAGLVNKPGAITWYELATHDAVKARAFYTQLLGWEAETQTIDGELYTIFTNNGRKVAGMVKLTEPNTKPHWRIYFSVEDCDATIRKAITLGGEVSVTTTNISGIGDFAVLRDPQGVGFGITARFSLD